MPPREGAVQGRGGRGTEVVSPVVRRAGKGIDSAGEAGVPGEEPLDLLFDRGRKMPANSPDFAGGAAAIDGEGRAGFACAGGRKYWFDNKSLRRSSTLSGSKSSLLSATATGCIACCADKESAMERGEGGLSVDEEGG